MNQPRKVKLVLAGSYKQFLYHCQENGWLNAVYVRDRRDLLSRSPENVELLMVGTVEENPNYNVDFWADFEWLKTRQKASDLMKRNPPQEADNG